MKEFFGNLPDGGIAHLYTISCCPLTAKISDLGATLVQLHVPDQRARGGIGRATGQLHAQPRGDAQ